MVETTRHFSATTYVRHNDKVLLHNHKKLKMWLPVGGHIDRDELPQDAAKREVKEETGLDVEIIKPKELLKITEGQEWELILPFHMMLHNLNEYHQHIDMVFFAKTQNDKIVLGEGESREIKWFTKEEIESHENISDVVKSTAIEILSLPN